MCFVSALSCVFSLGDIAWLIHSGTHIYIKSYFLQVAHLSQSESASSGHLCSASGRVRRRQSCVSDQHGAHTHTHIHIHNRTVRSIVLLWVCVFSPMPQDLMPLTRLKWKDKPYCSNELPLLLSYWNRGKDEGR